MKLILKFDSRIFLIALVLNVILCSCNAKPVQAKSNRITKNDFEVEMNDKDKLVDIIRQLNKDYEPIMSMYALDMEDYANDRKPYIVNFNSMLGKINYITSNFKNEMILKLKQGVVSKQVENLRPIFDPLFKATEVSDKIIIDKIDVNKDLATVYIELFDSYEKTYCCYTRLEFAKIKNNWVLTGSNTSKSMREKHPKRVSMDKLVGFYANKQNSSIGYSIEEDTGFYYLMYCAPECKKVGEIDIVEIPSIGNYEIFLKEYEGEYIATFKLVGNELKAYNKYPDTKKWEIREFYKAENAKG